ncbi:MAG: hypothetical protein H6738_13365 [Alphaproteobacteria bacterium]|nr:hypothetical protein [Alphaproteobacteria bacterium]MCB9697766.1 hypothetical protein [Alphaproteobacteria bacterium]
MRTLLLALPLAGCSGSESIDPYVLDLTVRYQDGQEDLFDGREVKLLVGPPGGVPPTLFAVPSGAGHGVQLDVAEIPPMTPGTRVGLLAEDPGGVADQWTPELTAGYGDVLIEESTDPGTSVSIQILVPALGEIGTIDNIPNAKHRMLPATAVAPDGSVYIFGGIPGLDEAVEASDQILTLSHVDEGDTTFDAAATRLPTTKGPAISGGDREYAGRCALQATLMEDGLILVTGGRPKYLEPWAPTDQWLLFDPVTDQIVNKGKLPQPRMDHLAVRFQGGKVLVYGGSISNNVERTPSFSIFDPERARADSGPVLADDATGVNRVFGAPLGTDVVVCGGDTTKAGTGVQDWEPHAGCQRIQPTGDVADFDPLPVPLSGATMTSLPDGGLLVVGGFSEIIHDTIDGNYVDEVGDAPGRTEVYRWADGAGWALVANLTYARAHHAASILADGRVLIVGGDERGGALFARYLAPVRCPELFDPATNTVTAYECTDTGSGAYATAVNADGTDIFVMSGYQYNGSAVSGLDRFGYTAYGPPLPLP